MTKSSSAWRGDGEGESLCFPFEEGKGERKRLDEGTGFAAGNAVARKGLLGLAFEPPLDPADGVPNTLADPDVLPEPADRVDEDDEDDLNEGGLNQDVLLVFGLGTLNVPPAAAPAGGATWVDEEAILDPSTPAAICCALVTPSKGCAASAPPLAWMYGDSKRGSCSIRDATETCFFPKARPASSDRVEHDGPTCGARDRQSPLAAGQTVERKPTKTTMRIMLRVMVGDDDGRDQRALERDWL